MTTHLSIELPPNESFTLGEWAAFVEHARVGGAGDADTITPIHDEMDSSILTGWRIQLDPQTTHADRPIRVPGALLRDIVDLLGWIDAADGDTREFLAAVIELRTDLLDLLLPAPGGRDGKDDQP